MNLTQEQYSKLTDREKFLLSVAAFKETCKVLFNSEIELNLTVNNVPFTFLAEMSQENGKDIRESETVLTGKYFTLNLAKESREDIRVSTFKF